MPDQGRRLQPLFARHQAEVGVEDVELDAVEIDRDPHGAAPLQSPHALQRRQGALVHQTLGPVGQDRVAIALLLDAEGGVEVVGHGQFAGDGVGLVDPAGARAQHVHLLQADDVGFELGDHRGDAADIEPAIHADAAMHVVGQDPRHGSA